jgi:putative ABC transport system permease protein
MAGNHLKLILRKIFQTPFLTFINILCLSTGMITILFISLWIRDELSYDRFHPSHEKIYRLSIKVDDNEAGYHSHFARSYYSWLYNIKDKLTGIKDIARLNIEHNGIIMTPAKEAFRANIIMSDPSVFNVFWFSFQKGSALSAFEKPHSIVLTKSAAFRYFGNADPIGQTIEIYCDRCTDRKPYLITGVVEDYPTNSHFHFDMMGNIENPESFSDWAFYYLKLDDNTDPSVITDNFASFAAGYLDKDYIKNLTPYLQPVSDIHIKSKKDREIEENGNYRDVWLFLGLSFFVLFVALFNFINVRQVSLIKNRKTLSIMRIHGASHLRLFMHQLTESVILSGISAFIAAIFVLLFLPAFNHFTGKAISLVHVLNSKEWWLIMAGLLILSVLTGVYPFLYSGIIKRIGSGSDRNILVSNVSAVKKLRLTRIYVAIQFAVSIILIITVLVVNRQVDFFMDNRLGSSMDKILCIKNIPVQILNNYQLFKTELLKNPLIHDITCSFENPAYENMDMMRFETINVSDEIKDKHLFVYPADDNYFDFYDIKFLAGSAFPVYTGNDSLPESYILNKKACDFLGWDPSEAMDKPFKFIFELDGKNLFNGGRIVGVVEDFQMASMKNEMKPYVFFQKSFWMESVQIKFDTSQNAKAFSVIQNCFDKFFPGHPMQYDYVEDLYKQIYKNENQLKSLSMILGILAILLSSLGLWGITGIIYQSKTKEIGIRKVNGALKSNIIFWLLKDINLIVIFSILAGIPVSYILMRDWLMNFPLHIAMKWWMFVFPVVFIYLIAVLTVYWQANKAAGMNPVESLRCE